MTRGLAAWSLSAVAVASAAFAFTVADADSPLRIVAVIPCVLFLPGFAIVRLLRLTDVIMLVTLAVAVSFALAILVPGILVYAGAWSSTAALALLVAVTFGGIGAEVALAARARPR